MAEVDPFAPEPQVFEVGGRVSFTFHSAPGYDRIDANVEGSPEFVAKAFGIKAKDFDGKISTLMQQAVMVDWWFKHWDKNYEGPDANQGKA